ncbi:N-alpha-acetyltransferase RimI [Candidatus Thermoflexus japonica]|uniref:N-alpha-acetyltransferase RimI n=1 Tax=Candidatus Thermoflexus japonica TaxID=2035417 RepID=A0A2H5Y9H3_9CHLR|nr:N-alpha-acetyltransferase RimI [Candidatus Thermoflexus japonica]
MVHVAGREAASGLRPADVRWDLRGIADLLEVAFASELDEIGQRIIRELRFWSRLGWVLKGLEWFLPPGETFAPGYVWVEGGRVVGYAMVRRFRPGVEGWLIANVAVAPEFRGRGIGRALVSACLEYARAHGARWAALQVRADNAPALRLYRSLGFVEIGRIQIWRREAWRAPLLPSLSAVIPGYRVRPARPGEVSALSAWIAAAENPAMQLFEPLGLLPMALAPWPFGRRWKTLWIIETEGGEIVAIAAWIRREGALTLRAFLTGSGTPQHARWLVETALMGIPPRLPVMALTGEEPALSAALLSLGFQPIRTLIGMRHDLKAG